MNIPEGRIHIVGGGGSGMSAIAKVLVAQGHDVSASDLRGGPAMEALADLGVATTTGHTPDVVSGAGLVVASSAVPDYDEELARADELGIPIWRRPQLLESLTSLIPTIGATGTHGKTTTTAMLITALRQSGVDPSFIIGGDLTAFGTNGHLGQDDLLVLEADEAFRTFESLHLSGLVLTNVEPEHISHFGSEEALLDSFEQVVARVDGPCVVCLDDVGSAEIARRTGATTYGTHKLADWQVRNIVPVTGGVAFDLNGKGVTTHVEVPQPGVHVALNAAGALALLGEMGRNVGDAAAGLSSYRGVSRRWDHRGTVQGVVLIDDYAHHPTEVAAVLTAAKTVTTGRVWAVFQPHLYSRTERFSDEFGEALAIADVAVVTDVFGAREEPVPGVSGRLVSEAAAAAGIRTHYVPRRMEIAEFLAPELAAGDLVLSLGAGDITLLHSELAPLIGSNDV